MKKLNLLTIVACMHGDEVFGKQVIDRLGKSSKSSSKINLVFANEKAYAAKKRYIDSDLNRSFNRSDLNGHETSLTSGILDTASQSEFLLDIHTTNSQNFSSLAIVTNLSPKVKQLLSHINIPDVAIIQSPEAIHSLIGNHGAGVSLEFGKDFTEKSYEPLEICIEAVKNITSKHKYGPYRFKNVFDISKLISFDDDVLPAGIKNGEFSHIHNGYVIMPKPIKQGSNYQGFLAKNVYRTDLLGTINHM